jgi:hypothetical protein
MQAQVQYLVAKEHLLHVLFDKEKAAGVTESGKITTGRTVNPSVALRIRLQGVREKDEVKVVAGSGNTPEHLDGL